MGKYQTTDILFTTGEKRNVDDVVRMVKHDLKFHNNDHALLLLHSIKNHAFQTGDKALLDDVFLLEGKAGGYGPFPSDIKDAGDIWNMQTDYIPQDNSRETPSFIKLNPEKMVKRKMAQFIHLTWKAGWYVTNENKKITLADVNKAFTSLLGDDFNAESGNLSSLYKGGNWEGLPEELDDMLFTIEALVNEIKKLAEKEKTKRNP